MAKASLLLCPSCHCTGQGCCPGELLWRAHRHHNKTQGKHRVSSRLAQQRAARSGRAQGAIALEMESPIWPATPVKLAASTALCHACTSCSLWPLLTHTHTLPACFPPCRSHAACLQSHLNTVGSASAAPPGISALSLLSSGIGALLNRAQGGQQNLGASGAGIGRSIGIGAPVGGPVLPAGAVIRNLDVLKQQPGGAAQPAIAVPAAPAAAAAT